MLPGIFRRRFKVVDSVETDLRNMRPKPARCRRFAALAASFAALIEVLGCVSTADVLSTPMLDDRVPSLRPATDGPLNLVSRHVCASHTTVNVWYQKGGSDDIQIDLFDSYKCRSVLGFMYFEGGRSTEGESVTVPRSSEREFPLSVFVSTRRCDIYLPPALEGGKIFIIVEIDEEMATTRWHAYTPKQDRALARALRRRESEGRACREKTSP